MLYDAFGRVIPDERWLVPRPGQQIFGEPGSDRESLNISRRLSPLDIDRMMIEANGGDPEAQCRLARELPELNHDVKHAIAMRRNAVLGLKWTIKSGDDTPAAESAAESLKTALEATGGKYLSFPQMLHSLTDALLPGFTGAEIIWKPGGAGFYGFKAIESRFFSFANSYTPKLRVSGNYNGIELPPSKVIFHFTGENGPDPVRGGLIRPLAWLHCFSNINFKDLLSFIERNGMPFIVAKVDAATWQSEGQKIKALIQNFGPSGGGVFSRNVEIELLQAANNTGEVYFRLLEYVGAAITKVVLGQTATSGDGGGWSKDNAQSQVRQDILEADARQLEDTVRRDLFTPWMFFNFGGGVALPKLELDTSPPEDSAALGTLVKTLYEAGFECDPQEVGGRLGLTLTKRKMESSGNGLLQLSERSRPPQGALETWLGPLKTALAELSEETDPAKFRRKLEALEFGNSAAFEAELEGIIFDGIAHGAVAAERRLKK